MQGFRDLKVYQLAYKLAMDIFQESKSFPKDERYSLTDQIRRSSRSVCANMAEAWRKRRYERAFVSKLCDSEGEAAETQVWLEFARKCGYMQQKDAVVLHRTYAGIIGMIVNMITHPGKWVLGWNSQTARGQADTITG